MLLLKTLSINCDTNNVICLDGIKCVELPDEITPLNAFWGETDIHVGEYADMELMKKKCEDEDIENMYFLSYVSEYKSEDVIDNYKKISFNISTPGVVDGYIVFIPHSFSEIHFTGEKLFGRYPTEIVAVLKEGNYIEFGGKTVKVINGELVLVL